MIERVFFFPFPDAQIMIDRNRNEHIRRKHAQERKEMDGLKFQTPTSLWLGLHDA